MRSVSLLLLVGLVGAGPGCASKAPPPSPPPPREEAPPPEVSVPPEKLDEIEEVWRQKQNLVARCYNDEQVRRKDRNLLVSVMISARIAPSGSVTDVKITQDSSESPDFKACTIEAVKGMTFPDIPKEIEVSHPYNFKPL